MKGRIVLFEQALEIALEIIKERGVISERMVLVRDFRGRIRLLLPGEKSAYDGKQPEINDLCELMSTSLGKYGYARDQTILYGGDLTFDNAALKGAIEIYHDERLTVDLLDRQITGQDWLREPYERKRSNPRATFFGIKGGVGRSTALIVWAWFLAKHGRKVVVFDLDLESPGVSSTLLPPDASPDFGIVDWFVEDGVGQGDALLEDMIAASPLAREMAGVIKIVPAFGLKTAEYLPKLSRCYSGLPGAGDTSWGDRLARLVQTLEERESPDIVLLDSRAGVHDIAATAVTRMGAFAFLFAVDSKQTWRAYSFLLSHWRRHPQLAELRRNLQIVASMVPETQREPYLERFRENAWDLFRDGLYDEVTAESTDGFNFDLMDEDAPHWPLPIFWHRALQEFEPVGQRFGIEEKTAEEAMDWFMKRAEELVFSDREEQRP